jgi:hypothetical protein
VCFERSGRGRGRSDRAASRACSEGEAIEGALRRRRHALGVGGVKAFSVSGRGGDGDVEDLKHVSGKNLLSVERTTRAPDIYIGGQMHDVHLVRRVAHQLIGHALS